MFILRIISGLALLTLGRQIYWVFAGVTGFLLGLDLAARLLPGQHEIVFIIIALILGVVGALLAIAFQQVAIILAGFAAAGLFAVALLEELRVTQPAILLVFFIVAGIIGAVLVLLNFDWAVILLSSIFGAAILARTIPMARPLAYVVFLVLAALGVIIQGVWYTTRRQAPAAPTT